MCEFCPDGLTVDPTFPLPTGDGTTCSTAQEYAATLLESDDNCQIVQLASSSCCPQEPVVCSCSPADVIFQLNLSTKEACDIDDLEGSPGIDSTLCLLDLPDYNDVGKEYLPSDLVITSIQFIEFDASGELNVINTDDGYIDTELKDGDIFNFASVSNELNPLLPIEDQLDKLPGGASIVLNGILKSEETGEQEYEISNRITWSYTNDCNVEPIEGGESIGWITFVSRLHFFYILFLMMHMMCIILLHMMWIR